MKFSAILIIILFTINVYCERRVKIKKFAHCHEEQKPLAVVEPTNIHNYPNGTLIFDLLFKNPSIIIDNNTVVKWQVDRETKSGQFQKFLGGVDESGLCQMSIKYSKATTVELENALGIPNPGTCPIGKGTWRVKNYAVNLGTVTIPPMIPSGNLLTTIDVREKSTNKVVFCITTLVSV